MRDAFVCVRVCVCVTACARVCVTATLVDIGREGEGVSAGRRGRDGAGSGKGRRDAMRNREMEIYQRKQRRGVEWGGAQGRGRRKLDLDELEEEYEKELFRGTEVRVRPMRAGFMGSEDVGVLTPRRRRWGRR